MFNFSFFMELNKTLMPVLLMKNWFWTIGGRVCHFDCFLKKFFFSVCWMLGNILLIHYFITKISGVFYVVQLCALEALHAFAWVFSPFFPLTGVFVFMTKTAFFLRHRNSTDTLFWKCMLGNEKAVIDFWDLTKIHHFQDKDPIFSN